MPISWIPIKNEPPFSGQFLIAIRIGNKYVVRISEILYDKNGNYDFIDPQDGNQWGGNITHWMPLPEFPSIEADNA
jgi:hypothetical protein